MTSTLEEQLGVASSATYRDVGDFRLWQSTDPGIILYVARSVQLARAAGGRYHAAVTQVQRWRAGSYEVIGGSAIFGVFGDTSTDDDQARRRQEQWARVLLNTGYKGADRPRFMPLPVRDIYLTHTADSSQARTAPAAAGSNESRTLVLELSAPGAREWVRAVREKATVPGSVRLSYTYPQMMPSATASVTLHGARVYTRLSTTLKKATDGTLYG